MDERDGGGVNGNGVRRITYGSHVYGGGAYGHAGWSSPYRWRRHHNYFYIHGYYGSLYYPMLGLSFGYLPYGYYPFFWGDAEYYYDDGLFYQYDNDQYTVVEPPIGAEVKSLPSNAQSIVINGEQYYEDNGVYYLPVTKDDGSVVYEVAGKDGELNTGANGAVNVIPKVGDTVSKLPPDCRKVDINGARFFVSEDGIYYQEALDGDGNKVYKIVGLETDNQDSGQQDHAQ